jgi:hypothetical protein
MSENAVTVRCGMLQSDGSTSCPCHFTSGETPPYLLHRKLCHPQNWSGLYREEKDVVSLPRIEFWLCVEASCISCLICEEGWIEMQVIQIRLKCCDDYMWECTVCVKCWVVNLIDRLSCPGAAFSFLTSVLSTLLNIMFWLHMVVFTHSYFYWNCCTVISV